MEQVKQVIREYKEVAKNVTDKSKIKLAALSSSNDAIFLETVDLTARRLFTDVSEPYINGDGTSRQWLFFAASTTKKEVMVVRVRDGMWDRQDVSASLYRDLFAAQGIVPQPVDIATALDSDEVVKIAREHGYRVQNLDDMYVQLGSEDRKSYSGYKPSEPNWIVFGEMGKAIVVKPDTGEIVQNDF